VWLRAAVIGSFALNAVVLLQVVGAVAQGLALPARGADGLPGDTWHRIGFAFLGNVGLAGVVTLFVAVLLGAVPRLVDAPADAALAVERRRRTAMVTATALAAVVFLGSLLAWRARLHQFSVADQVVPAYQRWALFSYLAGNLTMAMVVVAAANLVRRAPSPDG